jgi:hypothetical protein
VLEIYWLLILDADIDRPESEYDMVKKKEEQYLTSDLWRQLHGNDPIPKALSQPCCAQFAVSGDRIRARPLADYQHYRQWLIDTPLADEFSGRMLEYNWQYIFTGQFWVNEPRLGRILQNWADLIFVSW